MKLLIVGNSGEVHIGYHFLCAARDLGIKADLLDTAGAYGEGLGQKLLWRLDRIAARHATFNRLFIETVHLQRPDLVLVSGLAPLSRRALSEAQRAGAKIVNFLTDDPWNPAHRSRWFFSALPQYDMLFSPRRANLEQLRALSANVAYLPFAYNPSAHFVERTEPVDCDVVFVGGADADRLPYIQALSQVGLVVWAYGGYWERANLKGVDAKGFASGSLIRRVTSAAKANLILVRYANRDGHVMRSFEAAACGGCLLVEDTLEHRAIFGDQTVTYFKSSSDLPSVALSLVRDSDRRLSTVERTRERLTIEAPNTYCDRLKSIVHDVSRLA